MSNTQEGLAYLYEDVGTNPDTDAPDENTREGAGYQHLDIGVNNAAGEPDEPNREGYAYLYEAVGVNNPNAGEAVGYQYEGDVNTDTPTPHIWYVFPNYGRIGDEFKIVGHGFGDSQAAFDGEVLLNDLLCGVITWDLIANTLDEDPDPDRVIDSVNDVVNVEHQEIRVTVPPNAMSGLVFVRTDGP